MPEKLKDYQVIDVFCNGTFYKVRHKVTNKIFAWKAYNCSEYSQEQIQNVVNEVKIISKVTTESLLRYYDTILHTPSKTLYFVLEYNSWRSVQELIEICKATNKFIEETFIWHLLQQLVRVCKAVENINIVVIQKCINRSSIFVGQHGEVRVNCFDLVPIAASTDVMRQIGEVIHSLCYRCTRDGDKTREFHYSDDLGDIVSFLMDDRDANLRPDVVLYHPTVLMNCESNYKSKCLNEILVSVDHTNKTSEMNKCDSEKAVDLYRTVEPLPRTLFKIGDSPVYCNISPKKKMNMPIDELSSPQGPLSPTLAALALELPGYVPRSRKPYTEPLNKYHNCPQRISEETLSQQWMSRIVALRQREESLNKRERDLLAKEIVSSPATKIIALNKSTEILACDSESNGITLPPIITQAKDCRKELLSRRRRPRAGSVRSRGRKKSIGYEDLDSSLSADNGDGSIIITATKFTKENMPKRNIFPDVSTKKVHFTSSNPFIESDDSVTLTFYELDNVDHEGYQVPRQDKHTKDISKFKYLDLKKKTPEKRSSMHWSQSSPSKQLKTTMGMFGDITNHNGMRKTPSKTSLTSRSSNSSRQSMFSARSHWSIESSSSKISESNISERTRSAMKQCLPQTPVAPPDMKKSKSRKSLLNFKTPFKFMTATKI